MIPKPRVWVMNKREPVRLDEDEFGTFYEEDTYLVAAPNDEEGGNFAIYAWAGSRAPAIKRGVLSVMAIQLLLCLEGHAVIKHEEQGCESDEFVNLFINGGYNYPFDYVKDMGTPTGFHSVPKKTYPYRLFCVKDVKNIKKEEQQKKENEEEKKDSIDEEAKIENTDVSKNENTDVSKNENTEKIEKKEELEPFVPIFQVEVSIDSLNATDAYVLMAKGMVFAWWPTGAKTSLIARCIAFAQELRSPYKIFTDVITSKNK